MTYQDVLKSKIKTVPYTGFEVSADALHPSLALFQNAIVRWALLLGKAAIFAECGLGKTFMSLEWAKHVHQRTGQNVLFIAPLAVGAQTVREGVKWGIPITQISGQSEAVGSGLFITNYEQLDNIDAAKWGAVVIDESSRLKNFTGKQKRQILEMFRATAYKLACTATPAPNDYLELGNHADFLDVMASNEMISRWFANDTMEAGTYVLKKHGAADFWRWVTSWAVCVTRPADLGQEYHIEGYDLPPLNLVERLVEVSEASMKRANDRGMLLPDSAPSSTELHAVKRDTITERLAEAVDYITRLDPSEPFIVWTDTNDESKAMTRQLRDLGLAVIEVEGAQSNAVKADYLTRFSEGQVRGIVTKSSIAGLGLNWQHAAENIYVGLNHSFEKFYQSIRRTWRFGQTKAVNAVLIYSYTEGDVLNVIKAKQVKHQEMVAEMVEAIQTHGLFRNTARLELTGVPEGLAQGRGWKLHLGDCVTTMQKLPDNHVGFSVFSPPFEGLYVYSDSIADMGNTYDSAEFFQQYDYCASELYRITQPGRLCAVHCKDLPLYFNRDGAAGLRDFPGELIRSHERAGWVFHSRVTIWKDPVIEMQRTKNHGLLWKNFRERAEATRQGMADYMLIFRKHPIEGGVHVTQDRKWGDYIGTNPPSVGEVYRGNNSPEVAYSIALWQRYASPVWSDIDQTDVLNYQQAKANDDTKHICPLQLGVIRRCIDLWTNKGDLVFSPFAGIGSEGYVALEMGRRFEGVELKPEYHRTAQWYLNDAATRAAQPTLFDLLDEAANE